MSKVRIDWEEVAAYSQVFEIPDFDPGNDYYFQDKLTEAIVTEGDFTMVEVSDREITDWAVIPEC